MNEIVPGVLGWKWLSEPHGYFFNGFLLLDPSGNLCVDPVEPAAEELEEISRSGVSRIVLTNRNHARAANRVRAATGARIAVHPADAGHARGQGAEIEDTIEVGERIGPLIVVGVPGKSPGEVALHWPERRLLIVGDCVIGNPPGRLSLLRERVMDDPATLRRSVRRLVDLDFDAILVGDGEHVLEGAKERLAELVASFPAD
jgi:glyoxylase-like metal-dependent hydrolase (beta-lactamase superfamily II)